MTNEERIKSLSTEEFARFIADIVDCALCNNPIKCEGNYNEITKTHTIIRRT